MMQGKRILAFVGASLAAWAVIAVADSRLDTPVRYVGETQVDGSHSGGLGPVVGAKSMQVMRANRTHPSQSDGFGWTYNHAPMLAHWNGRFYLEYLSSPRDENETPMQTLLTSSADGERWDRPRVVFPEYRLPNGKIALMHQRMGFFVAPDGRLLVIGFYGLGRTIGYVDGVGPSPAPTRRPVPNDGTGVGRVVREVRRDGSFGPVYFVRYNRHSGWNERNTSFPSYTSSTDAGFVEACRALLANRLITMQWWEEDRAEDGFFPSMGAALKALSFYHRKDGAVVGVWKEAWTALSKDEGQTWSTPVQATSLVMASGKVWGQRTPDGRYALAYNPRADNRHRWPLAIVTSDDGETFGGEMLTAVSEVSPRRFNGLDKAFGPQYVRGIEEGNGTPPADAFWLTYSMNKEDIWVTRVPAPVRGRDDGPVADTFDQGATLDLPWNLYSPAWAPVTIAAVPSAANRSLELRDEDPYEYARAERVVPASESIKVSFKLMARQADRGRLEVELMDRRGTQPPVRISLDDRGRILALDGGSADPLDLGAYVPGTWYDFEIFRRGKGSFSITLNGRVVVERAEQLEPVGPIERVSFRTGAFRTEPQLRTPQAPGADLPGADERVPAAIYYIDDFRARTVTEAGAPLSSPPPGAASPAAGSEVAASSTADGDPAIVQIASSLDSVLQPARWWAPASAMRTEKSDAGAAVPLLVGLHGWSSDYRNSDGPEYEARARVRGWAAIFPNFRGANRSPGACASDAAVRDVLDAIAFAKRTARIDDRRIYLLGASGGGHMALIMAARHPAIWAGVSAWVPISDLAAWHPEAERLEPQHARDLEQVCGGPPGASAAVDAEYRRRSPLFALSHAAGVPIDLNVGIHDGHTGSVPISHSLRAFNALASANGAAEVRLSDDEIAWMVAREEVPAALRRPVEDPEYSKPVLLRRAAGPARLTVFDGGHEILRDAAVHWLARQQRPVTP